MRTTRSSTRLVAVLLTATLTACTSTDRQLPEGEPHSALVPIRASGLQNAWVVPDVDLGTYRRVRLAPVEVEFRPTPPGAGSTLRRGQDREFPLSPADQQRLIDTVTEVFREELGRSRSLSLTEDSGDDVLMIRARLVDIVSRVPPEGPGRVDIYVDEVGEATLVVELQDAVSGTLLARVEDRRVADPTSGSGGRTDLMRANSVTAWAEVRRLVRRWGSVLTRWLDDLHAG